MLDTEGFPIMRSWYLVHLKEKNLSATARMFKNFLLQQAKHLLNTQKYDAISCMTN
jgi:hypothetical protein